MDRGSLLVLAGSLLALFVRPDLLCLGWSPPAAHETDSLSPHLSGHLIDINEASLDVLREVPHLSERGATELLRYREKWGPLCSVDSMQLVPHIGESTVQKIRPFVRLAKPASVPLRINEMAEAELLAIEGVGPTLAGRIESQRSELDGFACVDQLLAVKGVGWKLASRLWLEPLG